VSCDELGLRTRTRTMVSVDDGWWRCLLDPLQHPLPTTSCFMALWESTKCSIDWPSFSSVMVPNIRLTVHDQDTKPEFT